MKKLILWIFLITFVPFVHAHDVELLPQHPTRYIVKPGDDLWQIANLFLKHPWDWRLIWRANPQITQPNTLYPGDIIELIEQNGRPIITLVSRGDTVVLTPKTRAESLNRSIPTIPIDVIKPFLDRSQIFMSHKDFLSRPYVLAMQGEHLAGGAGQEMYVRAIKPGEAEIYSVFRLGKTYVDPYTGEKLGFLGKYIAQTKVLEPGDPAHMLITKSEEEVNEGDRLVVALHSQFTNNFIMRTPSMPIEADLIDLLDFKLGQIGPYFSVVIDRGQCDGLQAGNVLSLYHNGKVIRDKFTTNYIKDVKIPDRHIGEVMVYQTFDHISFALIMTSNDVVHVGDKLFNPDFKQG